MPEYLFVYGTLRRGSNNKFALMLAERAQFVGPARVPGLLFDFGKYPGAVKGDGGDYWIHGEVHSFDDPELMLSLDEYEGSEYERAITLAHGREQQFHCWIYWYIGAETKRLIASGDWFQR